MNERSMMIIAAILTTTAAGCLHARVGDEGVRSSLFSRESSPISRIEERYRDTEGFELVLSRDAKGKVSAKAFDPGGKPIEVIELPLGRIRLTAENPKGNDQLGGLTFLTEGAFAKFDTRSCTCVSGSGYAYCYGTTCPH